MTHHWSALLDQVTHRTVMRYHPLLGFSYVPNIVARMPHERGGYLIRTNSTGFRSNVEFQRSLKDRPRILVFGDSFTDGQGCNNDERYPELLGEALGAEVYNFGTSGSGLDQQLLTYEEFGRPIDANLIVLGVALHNIERIQMKHRPSSNRVTGKVIMMPKPYFTLEGDRLKLHHVPVPRVRPELGVGEELFYLDEQGDPSSLQRLYFAQWLGRLRGILRSHFPAAKDHLRSLAYRAARVHMYDDYLDCAGPGWQLMAALIKRFKEQAGNVPLLVVPLPTFHYYVGFPVSEADESSEFRVESVQAVRQICRRQHSYVLVPPQCDACSFPLTCSVETHDGGRFKRGWIERTRTMRRAMCSF